MSHMNFLCLIFCDGDYVKTLWIDGYNKYKEQPDYKKLVYKFIIQELLDKLKDIDTETELKNRYNIDSLWCLKRAKQIAPHNKWVWDLSIIQDCAYAIRLNEIERSVVNENHGFEQNIEL